MEADFSGWVTKAGLKCSDGRTIMPGAFEHQNSVKVPLVWQHGHTDPENVLGHVVLEHRKEGVYGYAFFNKTKKADHARNLVEHGDINMMSIWANDLVERAKKVMHGAIREVSLVLSGANPGALIENVTIRHANDEESVLDDEVIIYTGLPLEHAQKSGGSDTKSGNEDDDTVEDVYNSMSEKQKQVLHYMIGEAVEAAKSGDDDMAQSNLNGDINEVLVDISDTLTDLQEKFDNEEKKGTQMKHNVFEDQGKEGEKQHVLSHSDMETIKETAKRTGSLKHAVEEYALAHGINDIDTLFPDAKAISTTPEWISRRTEWVQDLLGAVRKSPFSRIKTLNADLTFEDARAKGYVKGTLKKEEFFGVASRVTTPTTIYKKQSIDRDDVLDITDFDVIAWLKAEMRLMLDEELARAVLIGDGRDVAHEDKINEGNIRPIAKDHELYTTTINVNIDNADSSMLEVVDAIMLNRSKLKGTGNPTFYTTEYWIGRFLTTRDGDQRRHWKNLEELALELRVARVVPVEVMQDEDDLVGILVNPVDYVLGADRGGEVNMFDDFDIDYNKQKYLIETRCSGALVKVKAAMVVRRTAGTDVLVAPATPAFDSETGELTITDQTGVVYRRADTNAVINAAGSPYTVAPGTSLTVTAEPAAGYYFATSDDDQWTFTADAA